jgi:hypothetical protein
MFKYRLMKNVDCCQAQVPETNAFALDLVGVTKYVVTA